MARTDSLIALVMCVCLCVKQNTGSCNKNTYSNYRFTGIMSSYGAKIISCSLYSVFLFMQLVLCLAVRQKESRPSWIQHWEGALSPLDSSQPISVEGDSMKRVRMTVQNGAKTYDLVLSHSTYSKPPLVLTYFKPTRGTLSGWGTWLYKSCGLTLTYLWYCRSTKSRFHME